MAMIVMTRWNGIGNSLGNCDEQEEKWSDVLGDKEKKERKIQRRVVAIKERKRKGKGRGMCWWW